MGDAGNEGGGNGVINGLEDEEIDGRSWGIKPGKLGSVIFNVNCLQLKQFTDCAQFSRRFRPTPSQNSPVLRCNQGELRLGIGLNPK